ncbi:MAG: site-2 protease family protein, partial [Oscillospiraceae bacterium]|nr:site-2 protease family protein [Oscillospiraceae bacterium]
RYGINQLSGPVGVASAVSEATAMGLRSLLMLAAFITVNLGVFNLLPIPALDGGRLLFLLIEAVRGKPLDPKYEGFVHGLGFVLLFGLMIIVTFNDIVRLFKG